MNSWRKLAMLMLLLSLLTSAAFAEAIPIKTEETWELQSIQPLSDGSLLMCGGTNADRPFLAVSDAGGNISWSMNTADLPDGFYRSAIPSGENEYLALLCAAENAGAFAIHHIADGVIVDQSESISNAFGLVPVSDGCFLSSKPDGRYAAQITKCTFEGTFDGQLEVEGRIVFQGILAGDHFSIAYGDCIPPDDDPNQDPPAQGIAIAFDHSGNLLWRYDSVYAETFRNAAWSPNGNPVLISRANDGGPCALTELNGNGAVWRSEYAFSSDGGKSVYGEMYSIIARPDGYLVVASGQNPQPDQPDSRPLSLRLLSFALDGTLVSEREEILNGVFNLNFALLTEQNGAVRLLVAGKAPSEIWQKMWSEPDLTVRDIPNVALIKDIEHF